MKKFIIFCLLSLLAVCVSCGQEKTFTNDSGMEFVLIPSGSFTMGTDVDPNFEEGPINEAPAHEVSISQPFYLGVHEVTQEEWVSVMGDNPSRFKGRNNPVECVSWDDVQAFIEKLNQKEGNGKYRLPTEAEWEYAARAGTDSVYFFGDDAGELGQYAWYDEGRETGKTHPVGQKQPNPWGLYDIYGNVSEWVGDWYGEKYYADSPATDPKGPSSGFSKVFRGGSWFLSAGSCRSADRDGGPMNWNPDGTPVIKNETDRRHFDLGFRLAFSPDQ